MKRLLPKYSKSLLKTLHDPERKTRFLYALQESRRQTAMGTRTSRTTKRKAEGCAYKPEVAKSSARPDFRTRYEKWLEHSYGPGDRVRDRFVFNVGRKRYSWF